MGEERGTPFWQEPWFHRLLGKLLGGGLIALSMVVPSVPLQVVLRVTGQVVSEEVQREAPSPADALCGDAVCSYDPRDRKNHVVGPVALLDGGFCVCKESR